MSTKNESGTISVNVKDTKFEAVELTDQELANVTGGVYVPGSEVRINQSSEDNWAYAFSNGATVIYRGQNWRVTWFEYRDGRFYNFDLYNPSTNEIVNYVPASDVSVNVAR